MHSLKLGILQCKINLCLNFPPEICNKAMCIVHFCFIVYCCHCFKKHNNHSFLLINHISENVTLETACNNLALEGKVLRCVSVGIKTEFLSKKYIFPLSQIRGYSELGTGCHLFTSFPFCRGEDRIFVACWTVKIVD